MENVDHKSKEYVDYQEIDKRCVLSTFLNKVMKFETLMWMKRVIQKVEMENASLPYDLSYLNPKWYSKNCIGVNVLLQVQKR